MIQQINLATPWRVLGLDPGSRVAGYGLVEWRGRQPIYVDSGCIRLPVDAPISTRLIHLFDAIGELIQRHQPTEVAIESVFMRENAASALKLGQARGAMLCAVGKAGLSVGEYAPRAIKQAVVGQGGADKTQVQHMICALLSLPRAPQADAADALAVALCHGHHRLFAAAFAQGRPLP